MLLHAPGDAHSMGQKIMANHKAPALEPLLSIVRDMDINPASEIS